MLPPVLQRVIFLISLLLSLGLLAMSAWFSWQSVINMIDSGIRSYGLGLPAWYYQIGVPFGFALVLIRYLQHAIDVMRGVWTTPGFRMSDLLASWPAGTQMIALFFILIAIRVPVAFSLGLSATVCHVGRSASASIWPAT